MRRFTVMGFTEAELGFVLAAAFAALAASALTETLGSRDLAAENAKLKHGVDSVSAAFAAYKDSVRKRSNKTPRCSEKGEPPAAIAELRILGRDAYGVGGERVNYAGVESRLAASIARSKALGCHYLVRTLPTPGVDGPDHSAAVRRLWSHFDVDDRER